MKLSNFLKTTSQTFFIVLTLAASQAWAATPLSGPAGLDLDSRGNLYVANITSKQILVYNPSYVKLTKKTITAGLSSPYGVAFDSKGNLYAVNRLNSSVRVYDSTGKQKTRSTITNGVSGPTGIAIDGLDDVWVDNNYLSVSMYSTAGTLIASSNPGVPVATIATQGAWYVLGSVDHWTQYPTGEVLTNGGIAGSGTFGSALMTGAAFDKKGNYWVCQYTGEVDVVNPNSGVATLVVQRAAGQFIPESLWIPPGIAFISRLIRVT
ncbi:MAG: repeat containing protein [Acidobacteriaceae bacterium]|nr:repeat containing protein [Acidobacteriaceae bacterium]